MRFKYAALLLGVLTAGCSSPGGHPVPIIPDDVIAISSGPGGTLTTGSVVAAAAIYLIYDPLAPNWEIKEQIMQDGVYQLSLRMKRYNTGGDGEALDIVRRRALELQEAKGMGRYRVLAFQQSIESQTIGARRQAVALIRLEPAVVPTATGAPPDIVRTSFEPREKTETTRPVVTSKPVPKKPVKRVKKNSASGCDCKDQ